MIDYEALSKLRSVLLLRYEDVYFNIMDDHVEVNVIVERDVEFFNESIITTSKYKASIPFIRLHEVYKAYARLTEYFDNAFIEDKEKI